MKQILDLTKPLCDSIETYREGDYSDPAFACKEWCSVEKQGYRVSALELGTQTGTHIDAPSHFSESGNCLEALPLENLLGSYFLVDLPEIGNLDSVEQLCSAFANQNILFVRSSESGVSTITGEALDRLLELPPPVWVVDGDVSIAQAPALEFHRQLAHHDKYLIENLSTETARQVKPGGELLALPLSLIGTSGAPCRVVVRQSIVCDEDFLLSVEPPEG